MNPPEERTSELALGTAGNYPRLARRGHHAGATSAKPIHGSRTTRRDVTSATHLLWDGARLAFDPMRRALHKIGELSRLSGVPVKTIRYYSDLGILPPTEVTGSGLRLYSDADRARLELVRAMRETGIDLATIGQLLERQASPADTLAAQLSMIELGIRTLRRRHAILRAALARSSDGGDAFAYLDRLRLLTRLDALDRRELLGASLDRTFEGVPVDRAWADGFRRVVLDIPEELSDAQLDAWLELALLVTDDSFIAKMREVGQDFWGAVRSHPNGDALRDELRAAHRDVMRAVAAGAEPQSPAGRAAADAYAETLGRLFGREVDDAFRAELIERIARSSDPRAARYWELLATLKGWARDSDAPESEAYRWLTAALRESIGRASPPAAGARLA
jgi:DNA-binding transcriptional MerR regulator